MIILPLIYTYDDYIKFLEYWSISSYIETNKQYPLYNQEELGLMPSKESLKSPAY